MGRSSIGVRRAVCRSLAVHLLPALDLDAQALRTIVRSSSGWERALATSGSVRRSSKLEDKTGEIGALEPKEGQMLILPWCLCASSAGWYLYLWGMGMVRFSAHSLAGFQVPGCGIAVTVLRYFHRTLIVSVAVGMAVVGSKRSHRSGGRMTLSSLCSWSLGYGLRTPQIRFRTQSLL